MKFEYKESERCLGLYLWIGRGYFDTSSCLAFEECINEILAKSPRAVGYNLQRISSMNSTAFGAVLKTHRNVAAHGAIDFLINPNILIRDAITRLGIDRVVPIRALDDVIQELTMPKRSA